jgi:hypothetical protein
MLLLLFAAIATLALVSPCAAFSFELPPAEGHAAAAARRSGGTDAARRSTSRRRGGSGAGVWAPNQPWGGLNARDFGAAGDGVADDAPALQKAIDAALEQGRTLLVPAGKYQINSTLTIMSSARAHYAVPGPGYAKHPLRMIGEGYRLTQIVSGRKMHAILNFTCENSKLYGAAAPHPTENQFISDISLEGAALANYTVFAPGISRSRFERVTFSGALSVGASIGYGWCNYFEFCRFGGNGVGIHFCARAGMHTPLHAACLLATDCWSRPHNRQLRQQYRYFGLFIRRQRWRRHLRIWRRAIFDGW